MIYGTEVDLELGWAMIVDQGSHYQAEVFCLHVCNQRMFVGKTAILMNTDTNY